MQIKYKLQQCVAMVCVMQIDKHTHTRFFHRGCKIYGFLRERSQYMSPSCSRFLVLSFALTFDGTTARNWQRTVYQQSGQPRKTAIKQAHRGLQSSFSRTNLRANNVFRIVFSMARYFCVTSFEEANVILSCDILTVQKNLLPSFNAKNITYVYI